MIMEYLIKLLLYLLSIASSTITRLYRSVIALASYLSPCITMSLSLNLSFFLITYSVFSLCY